MLHVCLFFFLMIGHPPRSTLLPNTTLFRSPPGRARYLRPRPPREARSAPSVASLGDLLTTAAYSPSAPTAINKDPTTPADRKSTRLNSSHANISYAVFCLKKNTATNQPRDT